MTREERCKLAIERGFTYNSETGKILYNGKNDYIYSHNGYLKLYVYKDRKKYELIAHQFAWYWVNKECVQEIDHINGIRDDNRICNLRSVTRQQNQWNRTTAKGYYKQINKDSISYIAQIYINTKRIYLGLFNTEEEARTAYLAAKQIYHVI
jgi:phage tail tube protein FII